MKRTRNFQNSPESKYSRSNSPMNIDLTPPPRRSFSNRTTPLNISLNSPNPNRILKSALKSTNKTSRSSRTKRSVRFSPYLRSSRIFPSPSNAKVQTPRVSPIRPKKKARIETPPINDITIDLSQINRKSRKRPRYEVDEIELGSFVKGSDNDTRKFTAFRKGQKIYEGQFAPNGKTAEIQKSPTLDNIIVSSSPEEKTFTEKYKKYIISFGVLIVIILIVVILSNLIGNTYYFYNYDSNIKIGTNKVFKPTFTVGNEWITFGPPSFKPSGNNILNNCFDLSELIGIFEINISVNSVENMTLYLTEICLVDYCTISLNDEFFFSYPISFVQDINSNPNNSIMSPLELTTSTESNISATSNNRTISYVGKNTDGAQIQKVEVKFPDLKDGKNLIKIKYGAIGTGAIYFKLKFKK